MTPVAVLGGGPAGLAAAWLLARRGIPVTLLEREGDVGGLAASFSVEGVRVDHGSHRLHPSTPSHILGELRRLLGDDLQTRARNGRILLEGRWLPFPLRPAGLVGGLPTGTLLRLTAGAVAAAVRPTRTGTFAEAISTGLGRPLGEAFYFPYARKIWGVDPERLAGEQARRRVSAGTPAALAARVLKRGAGGFLYPRGGFGRIPEALGEAAVAAGADLRLGAEVKGLRRVGDSWEVACRDGSALSASLMLSTLPVSLLARLVEEAPPEVGEAAAALRYRSMVLVYLAVGRPRYTPYDAHYFPGGDIPITRLSEPKNYREDAADPPDRTVLCAEIPCERGDMVWAADERQLEELVGRGLQAAGLPPAGPVAAVRRVPFAYPVYELGFEAHLELLERWGEGLRGLVTFGRQGLFAHDNTHHALAMACAVAECVGEEGFDRDRWRRHREGFRSHVVED